MACIVLVKGLKLWFKHMDYIMTLTVALDWKSSCKKKLIMAAYFDNQKVPKSVAICTQDPRKRSIIDLLLVTTGEKIQTT